MSSEESPAAMTVGVYVHAEPGRLAATLDSVRAHAPRAAVVLLPDGPDEATRAALAAIDLPQLGTPEPRGAPACWNRLVAATEADVVVLLESGAVLAPGALDILLAALREPAHGLAGPSTNLAWNEQGAFRGAPDGEAAIAATARAARARFGETVRPLVPLHSLADFCFAVRRDVIEAVGAADESYGLGPCWEMDYSIRAARAGFVGVWACAAYVHRAPCTERRRVEEAKRFEASRRRYQDKFCARRLRGERGAYEPHCKGEDCAEFAPPGLIRVREPLLVAPAAVVAMSRAAGGMDTVARAAAAIASDGAHVPAAGSSGTPALAAEAPAITAGDRPLVSCIMPTRDRRAWLPQAIGYFLRQDFTDAELVIVDDGEPPVRDCVPEHPRIRYHRIEGRHTIGAKRNLACAAARGELIAHWDDDDWYPASRLGRQVEAMRASRADLCGTSRLYFYQPSAGQAWRYEYGSRGTPGLVGTSLVYRRQLWERHRFADIQVGEDVRFVRSGAAVQDLMDPALCVATIHAGNTSPRNLDTLYWRPHPAEDVHRLLGEDLAFYHRLAAPLISCIMPTADRRAFVPLGVRGFLAQDWPNRELIVVDDGRDPVGDLVAGVPGVRYLRLARRASIGAKRNLACSEARGELIAHWDDDDWYAPGRLSWQAAPIVAGQADITGLENRFMLQLPAGEFWTTRRELHQRMFVGDVHGGTLMFRRSLFAGGLRFPDVNLAEDAAFLRDAMQRGRRLARLDNPGVFVYMRHGRNAWQFELGRFLDPRGWETVAGPASLSSETLDAYRAAAALGSTAH
jgi:glycosyltransferase involved in cell wall biosynthesis/GT2 family glycosyltransferase